MKGKDKSNPGGPEEGDGRQEVDDMRQDDATGEMTEEG